MAVTVFNRTQHKYQGGKLIWYKTQSGWKSNPRTEEPLTFKMDARKTVFIEWGGADFRQDCNTTRAVTGHDDSRAERASQVAQNRAYEKLRNKVYKSAEMGLLVAERREALSLVVNRVGHLYKGFRLLKRGNFGAFLKHFGVQRKKGDKRRWTRPNQASKLWLEYWFGWSPLLSDIHSAIEVLQADYPSARVKAGARSNAHWGNKVVGSRYEEIWTTTITARCHMQADYEVSNPNLFRANQLGLLNPASIAWELVPFSFVVDWFFPVGNFLRQWTDWVGLSVSRPITSQLRSCSVGSSLTYWNYKVYEGPRQGWTIQRSERATFSRALNITFPVKPVFSFNGLSATRAATSIALLISIFLGRK